MQFKRAAYQKEQNKWWDGYTDEPVVLLDDADKTMSIEGLTKRLKNWTDKYGCDGEIKGGHVALQHQLFIVTSNNSPDEIWSEKHQKVHLEAIKDRFVILYFGQERAEARAKTGLLQHIKSNFMKEGLVYSVMKDDKEPEQKRARIDDQQAESEPLIKQANIVSKDTKVVDAKARNVTPAKVSITKIERDAQGKILKLDKIPEHMGSSLVEAIY